MDLVFKIVDFFKKVNKKYLILISLIVILTGVLVWYGMRNGAEPNPNYNVINKAQVAERLWMMRLMVFWLL